MGTVGMPHSQSPYPMGGWSNVPGQLNQYQAYSGGGGGSGGLGMSQVNIQGYLNTSCKTKKEEKSMFQNVKGYFNKHQDMIFTTALVILVDHFVFKGAFREKIKALVDKFLVAAEKKLELS